MSGLNSIMAMLNKALLDADTAMSEYLKSDAPVEDVAESLVELHAIKNYVGELYSSYSASVLTILQNANVDDMDVAGAKIEVRSAADRKKWNHDELAVAVSRRLIDMSVDMDTGEVLLSPQDIASKMLGFVQPSYWRVKELAKVGINADNFCEVGDYKTNIIIRKSK
jgi:hypothetical protein